MNEIKQKVIEKDDNGKYYFTGEEVVFKEYNYVMCEMKHVDILERDKFSPSGFENRALKITIEYEPVFFDGGLQGVIEKSRTTKLYEEVA